MNVDRTFMRDVIVKTIGMRNGAQSKRNDIIDVVIRFVKSFRC